MADREHGSAQLRLRKAVQKITLILARIQALEQLHAAIRFAHARIVAGGDLAGAKLDRVIQKSLEFDFGIAQYVRIRRTACRVLAQKFSEYPVLVLGREVYRFKITAEQISRDGGIDQFLVHRT